jgi:hypothetical protein
VRERKASGSEAKRKIDSSARGVEKNDECPSLSSLFGSSPLPLQLQPLLSISPLSFSTSSAVTALECAPASLVHSTDSRAPSLVSSSREMLPATAAVTEVEAFEISEAPAATLLLEFLWEGCGELGRGASIAALVTTSGARPRASGRGAGRAAAAAANC